MPKEIADAFCEMVIRVESELPPCEDRTTALGKLREAMEAVARVQGAKLGPVRDEGRGGLLDPPIRQ